MEHQDFSGNEQADNIPQRSSFDLRHPSNLDIRKEIANLQRQQRASLTIGYTLAQRSMEVFFNAGHERPDFGDESY